MCLQQAREMNWPPEPLAPPYKGAIREGVIYGRDVVIPVARRGGRQGLGRC